MSIALSHGVSIAPYWDHVILGQPMSKANQRQVVKFGGITRLIKSKPAREYAANFQKQCIGNICVNEDDDVELIIDVWYKSRRPDLACIDLIMDCLQGVAYKNDRQVKIQHAYWNLDKDNPRARIRVASISFGNLDGYTVATGR